MSCSVARLRVIRFREAIHSCSWETVVRTSMLRCEWSASSSSAGGRLFSREMTFGGCGGDG